MNNKILISEMWNILGLDPPKPASPDPREPREVAGTFMVRYNLTAMDEEILESISELSWPQIFDIATLSVLDPSKFQAMDEAYQDGISTFRETWKILSTEAKLPGLDRGAFITLSKVCSESEQMPRFVNWCLRSVCGAAGEVQSEAVKHSRMFKTLIPGLMPAGNPSDSYEGLAATKRALMPAGPADANPGPSLADISGAEKAMDKVAAAAGKPADELFLNQKVDLDRERVRNK